MHEKSNPFVASLTELPGYHTVAEMIRGYSAGFILKYWLWETFHKTKWVTAIQQHVKCCVGSALQQCCVLELLQLVPLAVLGAQLTWTPAAEEGGGVEDDPALDHSDVPPLLVSQKPSGVHKALVQ